MVIAGVPMRTPPGVIAERSPKIAFLLSVIPTLSHTVCILLPVIPKEERVRKQSK